MNDPRPLDASLSDLRSQLDEMDTEDDRPGHLRSLADDIENGLGRSIDAGAQANFRGRLTAAILQFEGSHPRITVILNELAEKLSDMGI